MGTQYCPSCKRESNNGAEMVAFARGRDCDECWARKDEREKIAAWLHREAATVSAEARTDGIDIVMRGIAAHIRNGEYDWLTEIKRIA